jgi:predicted ATPase/class 3 adenylate cyclase
VRRDLPTGTVTFLFTDVEGSTRLLHELGAEAYAEALAEHRRVIREACTVEGGVEVDTQGDAFFFAFPTATGALEAAVTLTDSLRSGPIKVRVGLHTGTPLVTAEGYVGNDVHRAARIAAAGHGGQVVVSSSTAALAEAQLVDLGEHRFKDLAAPERVYQLGDGDFAPLETLYRTNLPVPATPFLGREQELRDVVELLTQPEIRLVTLTGPGGTGKTRLALQAAAEAAQTFPAGIWWVGLASLRDAKRLPAAVAESLGVEDRAGSEIADVVADATAGRRLLLLLDNAEHLLPDVADEIARLRDLDGPTMLVTSRERMQLQGEHAHAVPGLAEGDAAALFAARARAVGQELVVDEAVQELCARLDRLPLALELAAARTVVFSPAQLLERLSQRLDLLRAGRDADPRQQTLRATIEWSYELLEAAERELLRSLAVFVGGATYDAAEAICDATPDTLQSLIDKSLLRRRDTTLGPRYWMLETIRAYADEKLEETGSADEVRRRHAEHMLELAHSVGMTMETMKRYGAQRHDVAIAEQDNLRAAIDWAAGVDVALAVEIAVALENFWVTQDPQEGVRRFAAFLARSDELPLELTAHAHRCSGNVTIMAGDRAGGVEQYEAALVGYREAGNEVGVLLAEYRAFINREVGDLDERRAGLEALLARSRELELPSAEVQLLSSLAGVESRQGDADRAVELFRAAAAKSEAIGFTWAERNIRQSLARALLDAGDIAAARDEGHRALELVRRTGDRLGAAWALTFFALLGSRTAAPELAGVLWGAVEAEHDRKTLGIWAEHRDALEEELPLDDPDFVAGRERGRLLSFDDALEEVTASRSKGH